MSLGCEHLSRPLKKFLLTPFQSMDHDCPNHITQFTAEHSGEKLWRLEKHIPLKNKKQEAQRGKQKEPSTTLLLFNFLF